MSAFAGANVLIIGGAGFVGSALARKILDDGVAGIAIVDNLLSSERTSIATDQRVLFIEGSIADDAILARIEDRFEYIFHLATFHGNQSSIHDPLADHANNTLTTLKLYEHIKHFARLHKVVYSAAGCSVAEKTFGDAKATEESDLVALSQDSPYSMSKIFGEFYSNYYFKQHALPTVRARFQNVYGPGEILGAGRWRGTPATVWRNVTPTFIYKALKGESLPLENEGIATRDFIYVEDIAAGLIACARHGKPGDVYNLASGVETSIRALAEKVNTLTGNAAPPQFLPRRPWDNSGRRYGSPDKAARELGFRAETDMDSGLRRTVQWTRDNLTMIESVIAKHQRHLQNTR